MAGGGDTQADYQAAGSIMALIAPDAGGLLSRAGSVEQPVEYVVPVSSSPPTGWNQGQPQPGPFATVTTYKDVDSIRWWGQGFMVNWPPSFKPILPSHLPTDLNEHIDVFADFQGGYPSIGRHAPQSFGNQVPLLNPDG